jgi:hypothetical protein
MYFVFKIGFISEMIQSGKIAFFHFESIYRNALFPTQIEFELFLLTFEARGDVWLHKRALWEMELHLSLTYLSPPLS